MTDMIKKFLDNDNKKVESIIIEYPSSVPVPVAADLLGCRADTLRTALEDGKLGFSERKVGKLNRGFVIPTAHFVRWYLCQFGA